MRQLSEVPPRDPNAEKTDPGSSVPGSGPPPPAEPARPAGPPSLTPEDIQFVNELSACGLLGDLNGAELARVGERLRGIKGWRRKLELLELYYAASGDAAVSRARRMADRFFLHRDDGKATARGIVQRLGEVAVELGQVELERIGGDEGTFVLRSGEILAAVVDEYEESLDTGEIDLRVLDSGPSTVTVRGLVYGLNILMDKAGLQERMVEIRGDPDREVYVAVTREHGEYLCQAGLLELDSVAELREVSGWRA